MGCREKLIEGLFTYGVKLRTLLKEEKPILRPSRGSLDEVINMDRIPKRDGFRENNGCIHPHAVPIQEVVRLVEDEKYWRRNLLNKKTQNNIIRNRSEWIL